MAFQNIADDFHGAIRKTAASSSERVPSLHGMKEWKPRQEGEGAIADLKKAVKGNKKATARLKELDKSLRLIANPVASVVTSQHDDGVRARVDAKHGDDGGGGAAGGVDAVAIFKDVGAGFAAMKVGFALLSRSDQPAPPRILTIRMPNDDACSIG